MSPYPKQGNTIFFYLVNQYYIRLHMTLETSVELAAKLV